MSRQQPPQPPLAARLPEQQRIVSELKAATALMLGMMSKLQSPEARLTAMWQEQQTLVKQLTAATTPARQLQIQAEIVALTEARSKLLQEPGEDNCFIQTISGAWGTSWIEEEHYPDGSRRYKHGYYRDGKTHRRYVSKYLVEEVQRMITAPARMGH